jgi:hypothetical protein
MEPEFSIAVFPVEVFREYCEFSAEPFSLDFGAHAMMKSTLRNGSIPQRHFTPKMFPRAKCLSAKIAAPK